MRLVTRGDMDGLVAAVLIAEIEKVDDLELIHPQDITDDKFEIRAGDIMANLPYHPACDIWFDHHELVDSNRRPPEGFKGRHAIAPSVARVVYDYYGHDRLARYDALVAETDRFDSAQLAMEDIQDPRGAILLGFTIDPRTGMGSFKDYFRLLMDGLRKMSVEDVLRLPEVASRIARYKETNEAFRAALLANSRMEGSVVVTDLRGLQGAPPVGNRFLVYTLFPESNVSVRLQWGPGREFVATTIGHSIFNRTCGVHIGHLCSDFGGGGHRGAGACVLAPSKAEDQIKEIVARLNAGG